MDSVWSAALTAAGVVVAALVTAAFAWRRDKAKGEIEAVAAEAAKDTTAGQLALDIARELRAELKRAVGRIAELEAAREADHERHDLERAEDREKLERLAESLHAWNVFYADLVTRWGAHRERLEAPTPPTNGQLTH